MKKFEDYSEEHVNFYEPGIVPDMLRSFLKKFSSKTLKLLDVGCGDGNLLFQLSREKILSPKQMTGVEPSPTRLDRAKKDLNIVQGGAEDIPFKRNTFDVVISTQVIEHLKDDTVLVDEAKRVLKKNGYFYVSSVVKKPYGVWIYWKDGTFVSDPTHYREYKSLKEFEQLIAKGGFEIVESKMELFRHPLTDLFFRLLIKLGLMNPKKAMYLYERNPTLFSLRNFLKLPMIGFYNVEVLAKKK